MLTVDGSCSQLLRAGRPRSETYNRYLGNTFAFASPSMPHSCYEISRPRHVTNSSPVLSVV